MGGDGAASASQAPRPPSARPPSVPPEDAPCAVVVAHKPPVLARAASPPLSPVRECLILKHSCPWPVAQPLCLRLWCVCCRPPVWRIQCSAQTPGHQPPWMPRVHPLLALHWQSRTQSWCASVSVAVSGVGSRHELRAG